jgi:hypothetical protein
MSVNSWIKHFLGCFFYHHGHIYNTQHFNINWCQKFYFSLGYFWKPPQLFIKYGNWLPCFFISTCIPYPCIKREFLFLIGFFPLKVYYLSVLVIFLLLSCVLSLFACQFTICCCDHSIASSPSLCVYHFSNLYSVKLVIGEFNLCVN